MILYRPHKTTSPEMMAEISEPEQPSEELLWCFTHSSYATSMEWCQWLQRPGTCDITIAQLYRLR